jgi:hypothetical protein
VINALKDTSINWRGFGRLVEDTLTVLIYLSSWQINHVRHETNSAAHKLVKTAFKQVINKVWTEEIHTCICDIVSLEQTTLVL